MIDTLNIIDAIAASGLFDLDFYLDAIEDGPLDYDQAIRHFVESGCRAGISPSLAIDKDHYLLANPDVATSGVDPLAHYFLYGLKEGREGNSPALIELVAIIENSGLFDLTLYNVRAGTNMRTVKRAILHYLARDISQRVSPSSHFDRSYYLSKFGDVAASGNDPYLHFVQFGRAEGRRGKLTRSQRSAMPKAPPKGAWIELASRLAAKPAASNVDSKDVVDVVIPVYRGIDDTLACIHSVLVSSNVTPHRVVVINDKGPEPALAEALREIADLGLVLLLENEENLGFVLTANRGMALSQKRDVLLLNSDTVVFGDWLDRMRASAYSADRVATVTPFSNNATIFSYPYSNESNHQELEVSFEELDIIAAKANAGQTVRVPTGVGFCFYVRRTAIEEIGFLDTTLFDKGYGEENDFCMRAIELGWDNLAALDVFVRHTGEVSFGANASAGKRKGYERLTSAHPGYETRVRDAIRLDVFRVARSCMDVARFARLSGGQGILMIEHGWGGGIERHVKDLSSLLVAEGIWPLVAKPAGPRGTFTLNVPNNDDFPNLPSIDWWDMDKTRKVLEELGVGSVHIHSLVGMDRHLVDQILDTIKAMGLRYYFTVHDYAPLCPRINMIDWGGSYCDTPSLDHCIECVARAGTPFGDVDVAVWQDSYRRVIADAAVVMVPHADVAERLVEKMAIDRQIVVRPHPFANACKAAKPAGIASPASVAPRRMSSGGHRRVGLIGAIGPHKGARILESLCADAIERELDIDYIVYGHTDFDHRAAMMPNLTVTGKYDEDRLPDMFARDPADLLLYLSVWPETFCYTLDFALEFSVHPISFDLGAPASRIRNCGFGSTLPLAYMYNPSKINDHILGLTLGKGSPKQEAERQWLTTKDYYDIG